MGRDILKELIETDTTHATGSTTVAAERMAARLLAAGFPKADVLVVRGSQKEAETKGNLVVRYRGKGARKPVLFIAHLDVVAAKREDWSMDPFVLNEKDGYFYGRGTHDQKGGAATLVAAFVRLRQEQWVPDRDLILALTADEEGGTVNGVDVAARESPRSHRGRLLHQHRYRWRRAARRQGDRARRAGSREGLFASFSLTVKNAGGHSSLPTKDNAIYRLAAGLQRLAAFEFPVRLTDITRTYFDRMARRLGRQRRRHAGRGRRAAGSGRGRAPRRKSPFYNALLRTTCVATMLQAGHAENALPQTAQATVNCRLLPDRGRRRRAAEARAASSPIRRSSWRPIGTPTPSPPSPLAPEPLSAIEAAAKAVWGSAPAVPIIPFMETGATDGLHPAQRRHSCLRRDRHLPRS